ncbi:MAG TPA: hypothetical protein VF476_00480 [Chitinophagaceae bacterium]
MSKTYILLNNTVRQLGTSDHIVKAGTEFYYDGVMYRSKDGWCFTKQFVESQRGWFSSDAEEHITIMGRIGKMPSLKNRVKTYRLLKDTIRQLGTENYVVKAGTEFTYEGGMYVTSKDCAAFFSKLFVENEPEWFECHTPEPESGIMMKILRSFWILLFAFPLFLLASNDLPAQDSDRSQSKIDSLFGKLDPKKWAASIEKKSDKLTEKIIAKSQKTLSKLQKQEEKIYRKMLRGKDSVFAKQKLSEIEEKYAHASTSLNMTDASGQYISQLDSTITGLKFLESNGSAEKIKDALASAQSLKEKFGRAEEIKKFIKERREQLKAQLQNLGMVKELKKFNKEVFYYSEQLKEYKSLLKDKKKREKKAMELLSRSKWYKDFFRKNSQLASLFRLPGGDPTTQASIAGLQTRASVNNLIQSQIGANGMQQFRTNIASAQSQLQSLKNKILKSGGHSSSDETAEGFKPNSNKTKSFLKRLELGTNIQTVRSNGILPVISDLGLLVGYKLNDKSVIGIGGSYKMGWGNNIRNIKITHQGVGVRSFVDVKLKRSLWLSGGYELNWKPELGELNLSNVNEWSESGLLGLSKVVSVKSKFFKKTKLQLLWDFLSYQQRPVTQPIVFRVGYSFK